MVSHPPGQKSIRLFVEAALENGAKVELSPSQAHYLSAVMRAATGDRVALFNGRDGEWSAAVERIARNKGTLRPVEQTRLQESGADLWLVFAPVKKTATHFIAEKATELGVSLLWPVFTAQTATRRVNLERLRANAIEAAEQCGRLDVPEINTPLPLDAFCRDWPQGRRLLVLDESGGGEPIAGVLESFKDNDTTTTLGILSGPEGGFSSAELDALGKLPFVTHVALGPRILRAETAALAALACCQAIAGDW